MAAASRLIPLGVFGAPHGVRGELRVKSYTRDPAAIGRYGDLTDKAGARTFKIAALRPLRDDMLVVRLAGVGSRLDAEKLAGVELFVAREQLPAPSDEEFYHDDLIGLEAVTRVGETLGRVVALHNFGAGDILEIAPAAGGETLMLPFSKAVAVEIDLGKRRIVIVPPDEIDGEGRNSGA
ncbi:MAG: ribosome maturation factor RimM [Roseiarcus sp.]